MLVGGGVFNVNDMVCIVVFIIFNDVKWIKVGVVVFVLKENMIVVDGCCIIKYEYLVVCLGIKFDWNKVEGLSEILGENGVILNYCFDLVLYIWELVKNFKKGKVVFI